MTEYNENGWLKLKPGEKFSFKDERLDKLNTLLKMFDCDVFLDIHIYGNTPVFRAQVDGRAVIYHSFDAIESYAKYVLAEEQYLLAHAE